MVKVSGLQMIPWVLGSVSAGADFLWPMLAHQPEGRKSPVGESWTLRALGLVPLGFESLGPHLLIVVWGLPWKSFASRTVYSFRQRHLPVSRVNE